MSTRPLLHERFQELRATLPHVALGRAPATPVRRLRLLEAAGGSPIWLKDDGGFGVPMGGNKPRKLEWILADARRRHSSILTFGALGTNHGLATAVYGRSAGLHTVLALVDQPLDDHVREQFERILASGASVHLTRTATRTAVAVPWLMARHFDLRRMRPPYFLTVGGSSPLGSVGFVEAAFELAAQVRAGLLPEPSHVAVAAGSGGTAAGLLLGLRMAGLSTRLVAVLVNDKTPLDPVRIARLAGRTEALLRDRGARFEPVGAAPGDMLFERRFLGPGYGHGTAAARSAADLAWSRAGLRLDPVYTAKAMAGLLALAGAGDLGSGPVLYWHTHDTVSPPGARPADP
jgi:D-cysteine desulfhydrase